MLHPDACRILRQRDRQCSSQFLAQPASFSSAPGATACTPAPAGSYATGPGSTSSTLCLAGTFSSAAAPGSLALPAPAGSFGQGPLQHLVNFVRRRNIQQRSRSSSLHPCAPRHLRKQRRKHRVTVACPAGRFSNTLGCDNLHLQALRRLLRRRDGQCSSTAVPNAGTFSNNAGTVICTPAPIGCGERSAGRATIPRLQLSCPAGTFSSVAGQSACTPAPPGSYVSGTGSTSATIFAPPGRSAEYHRRSNLHPNARRLLRQRDGQCNTSAASAAGGPSATSIVSRQSAVTP